MSTQQRKFGFYFKTANGDYWSDMAICDTDVQAFNIIDNSYDPETLKTLVFWEDLTAIGEEDAISDPADIETFVNEQLDGGWIMYDPRKKQTITVGVVFGSKKKEPEVCLEVFRTKPFDPDVAMSLIRDMCKGQRTY